MLYLKYMVTLCMSFTICIGAMEKQKAASHSGGGRSLSAIAGQLIAPLSMSDANWRNRRTIVQQHLEAGAQLGDLILVGQEDILTGALHEREKDDIDFVRFLLGHEANFIQRRVHTAHFLQVKTPAMAQLLFDNGASTMICPYGSDLLCGTIRSTGINIPMLTWYIEHGVDVNGTDGNGTTPLYNIVTMCEHFLDAGASALTASRLLMQAGALLSAKVVNKDYFTNGYTVPQWIKWHLEYSNTTKKTKDILNAVKTTLSTELDNRHTKIQHDVVAATNLIPEIAAIIRCFYESTYQELEAMPYPSVLKTAR